nr:AHH domain-containing protein [Corallococcus aberystwythensis]
MELKDPENVVEVPGHRGPHPQRYHELVMARLNSATANCRKVEDCRVALTRALEILAKDVRKRGTELNLLVTRGG